MASDFEVLEEAPAHMRKRRMVVDLVDSDGDGEGDGSAGDDDEASSTGAQAGTSTTASAPRPPAGPRPRQNVRPSSSRPDTEMDTTSAPASNSRRTADTVDSAGAKRRRRNFTPGETLDLFDDVFDVGQPGPSNAAPRARPRPVPPYRAPACEPTMSVLFDGDVDPVEVPVGWGGLGVVDLTTLTSSPSTSKTANRPCVSTRAGRKPCIDFPRSPPSPDSRTKAGPSGDFYRSPPSASRSAKPRSSGSARASRPDPLSDRQSSDSGTAARKASIIAAPHIAPDRSGPPTLNQPTSSSPVPFASFEQPAPAILAVGGSAAGPRSASPVPKIRSPPRSAPPEPADLIPLVLEVLPDLCTEWALEVLATELSGSVADPVNRVLEKAFTLDGGYPKAKKIATGSGGTGRSKGIDAEAEESTGSQSFASVTYRRDERRGTEYETKSQALLFEILPTIPIPQ